MRSLTSGQVVRIALGWVTRALDRRGTRLLLGAIYSMAMSLRFREVRMVRWSRAERAWLHRWPEGRVADTRPWRGWREWATEDYPYDIEELLFRHYRPEPGDIVVDVGAGHGGETFLLAGLVGPAGCVLSIEAAPRTFERLEQLRRLNGWQHVHPIGAAVSDHRGTLMISESDAWVADNVYAGGTIEVPAVTIDDVCAQRHVDHIDWLKMNIEGAEKDAVRGMEAMAPNVRNLTIACHDFLGEDWSVSKDLVVSWLVDHGFTVALRDDDDRPWAHDYVYAWRTSDGSTVAPIAAAADDA